MLQGEVPLNAWKYWFGSVTGLIVIAKGCGVREVKSKGEARGANPCRLLEERR